MEDLFFALLGNGITVFRGESEKWIAHIKEDRSIYYPSGVRMTQEHRKEIETYAKTAHPRVSTSQSDKVFITEPLN